MLDLYNCFATNPLPLSLPLSLFPVMAVLYMGQRRHKERENLMSSKEDIRDNVIHYDDEGGGEEDTHAFDMGTLRNTHTQQASTHMSNGTIKENNGYGNGVLLHLTARRDDVRSPDIHCQSVGVATVVAPGDAALPPPASCGDGGGGGSGITEGDANIIREFIQRRLEESQVGHSTPPYDSLATYAYEGDGSAAESLSSIEESWAMDGTDDFGYLSDWGPSFKTLASILDRQPPAAQTEGQES